MAHRFDDPPIARFLGMNLVFHEKDRAKVEFEAGPQHANPMGTLHGGVFCDVADYAMGMAWATGLVEGETCTSIDLKINFLSPVRTGTIVADATVLRRGRTLGYIECEVRNGSGKLVAKASSTCMTLRGEQAVGR